MRDYFRKKTWIITALMFVVSLSLSSAIVYYEFSSRQEVKVIHASSSDNVSGWAWNANIGWVSFNCTNETPACSGTNYGVNIDPTTGLFSGYAWSSNVGWIDFAPTSGYPEAPNTGVHYDSATGAVTGWAKILSLGDNGWLKMSGAWTNGVSINSTTGEFSGWAWNANDDGSGIGWVSFNCSNETPACDGTDYKVVGSINTPPTAVDLTAPNWSFSQAGQYGALKAKLGWTFSDPDVGSSESAYQIIFDDDSNPSNPLFNSEKCMGYNNPTAACKIDTGVGQFPINLAMNLNYNTPYYWWIKVWDNNDVPSIDFIQYNTTSDTDNNDGAPLTFTTYKHEMPIASFTHFPDNPSRGEQAQFTNTSQVYLSSAPNTAVNCTTNQCTYLWTATAGASINDSATTSPVITFNSAGNSTITLKVTDNDGYYISASDVININAQLPKWEEVKPE